ncbi:hypothetical protein K501DRAFT_210725 [Backusella circina FSU 941]|nr:hypothetical protein K501DRAFT_210725 [Backusella circina FSU 941]
MTAPPPHPGLDHLDNFDELKHLCPAFAKGCPYANVDQVDSLAVKSADISRCPAFKEGCPFSTKTQEEVAALMKQIPKDHPALDSKELALNEQGVILVKMLNGFLEKAKLENIMEQEQKQEYLEDPQLAMAMREGTKVIHRAAETSVFTKRFLKGDINADEYGRYINSLYFVYKNMEALLEQYKDHPAVNLIYFPVELNRTEALLQDLEYFYGAQHAAELIDPSLMTPAVEMYVKAMQLACAQSPALLVAHSYSRYLGDLSGGQILAKRLKKHVLGLNEDDSAWDTTEGLNFYYFNNLGNQSEFKNSYREKLNAAKVTAETRDLIVTEAIRSFELNIALFDEVQQLSEANSLHPTILTKEEVILELVEEETIKVIEVNTTNQEKKKSSSVGKWLGLASLSIAAIAVGVAGYQRYVQKK